jgi:hypothetical protein
LVDFFADARELDRLLGDLAKGQSGATSSVSVEFGKYDSCESEGVMEMLGYTYRLLAGGCVADKKHLLRGESVLELTKLLEKGFVNFLAPGGIVDLDISALLFAPSCGLAAHLENVGLAGLRLEHVNPDLFAQSGELLDGSRALKIARDQQR